MESVAVVVAAAAAAGFVRFLEEYSISSGWVIRVSGHHESSPPPLHE